ncbi:MAG TPA: GGDEF domain-containing response regulator [Geminicoccaceae bacterium]|nr:GGDEF domain-containing response regulator [Geminicoccaceae bacterium]
MMRMVRYGCRSERDLTMAALESYHVLLIDDDLADAIRTADLLAQGGVGRFTMTRVATIADAARRLSSVRYDAVLLELILPDREGVDAVKAVLAIAPDMPVVVLTGLADERLALEAVASGAQDYLIKGQGDAGLLRRAIRHAIERKRVERELHQLARFDPLTGLPNRLLFRDRLAQAVRRIDRHRHFVALIFIDLDGFKAVNDGYGHATGDLLLKAVAGRLRRVVRRSDTVARLGGDEFTIVLEEVRHPQDAARVAEQALLTLRQPFELGGDVIRLGASLGVAIASHAAEVPDTLTHRADVAMYRAKARGGTRYQLDAAA